MHPKTVARYMRRSPYQTAAAILIMMLTFFMISVFAILAVLSVRVIDYFESKPQLTVFFKEFTKKEQIDALKREIEDTKKASSIVYVSKENALEIYKEQNKSDPLLLDLVTADILPASFEISAKEAKYLSDLAAVVKKSEIVEEVIFQKDVVDSLISWINALQTVGFAVIGVLLLESVFIIITIIGFKIIIRREEIEIMRLIGATNWFIRTPFILEGMVYGIVGALLGWAGSYALLLYATPFLQSFLKGLSVFPLSTLLMAQILGIEVLAACILGIFASFLAVLRYLK